MSMGAQRQSELQRRHSTVNSFCYVVCLFGTLVTSGCEKDGPNSQGTQLLPTPTQPILVDSLLVGQWYYLDTFSVSVPSPNIAFRGIQFSNNDTVHSLGIETETGRVGVLENEPMIKLRRASSGIIVMEYYSTWQIIDSAQYTILPDTLVMRRGSLSTTYFRTYLGYPFAAPIHCALDVRINNATAHNPRVAAFPSAYVSRVSSSELRLHSYVPEGWINVTIDSHRDWYLFTRSKQGNIHNLDGRCWFDSQDRLAGNWSNDD